MPQVTLSAGIIEYQDTGNPGRPVATSPGEAATSAPGPSAAPDPGTTADPVGGAAPRPLGAPDSGTASDPASAPHSGSAAPVLVLLHGVLMDGSLWDDVVAELRHDVRCVVPTLPLGGHRLPMRPGADLSLSGQVALVAELLAALELENAIVVSNDWGGAQLLVSYGLTERVGGLALCACEAFDNYPPGLAGRVAALSARMPGGINAAVQPLRLRPLRRLPITFGWMSKRRIPDATLDRWLRPAQTTRGVRRDLKAYAGGRFDAAEMLALAERQRSFTGPVLVAWATEDRLMPHDHGRRLAELFSRGRLVEIEDSGTLVPLDQPRVLAGHLRELVAEVRAEALVGAA